MSDDRLPPAAHDFDFLHGRWKVSHRRLRERLAGSRDWDTFTATAEVWPVLRGVGNVDRLMFDTLDREGITLRLFDLDSHIWTIHWADSTTGRLDPPLAGTFESGIGTFYGDDTHAGRPVRVRFIWRASATSPQWEQAFSEDGGATWETNWVMDFARLS